MIITFEGTQEEFENMEWALGNSANKLPKAVTVEGYRAEGMSEEDIKLMLDKLNQ